MEQDLHTKKKVLILLPDGAGIRNFIYSDFLLKCIENNLNISCWGREEILTLIEKPVDKIILPQEKHTTPLAELLRKAWQVLLLRHYAVIFQEPVYLTYIFKTKRADNTKECIKNFVTQLIIRCYSDKKNIQKLKLKYQNIIRNTRYYRQCRKELLQQNPEILFCTHQRSSEAIAPMLAANDLGIKTSCFIYSWDNIPKATLYVDANYYFVWSDYMKQEILKHHPEIKPQCILVTGSPQFAPYFDNSNIIDRKKFADIYRLPVENDWICYSGDDVTTSPHDAEYLKDLCVAVTSWNKISSKKFHILFRRCPTEINKRYEETLVKYASCVSEVTPDWKSIGNSLSWDTLVPQALDSKLLVSLASHCTMVVNIASTMALDFGIKGKPCIYMNYEQDLQHEWRASTVYNFVHFRSMGAVQPVIWLKSPDEWHEAFRTALNNSKPVLEANSIWMSKICMRPIEEANKRIASYLLSL